MRPLAALTTSALLVLGTTAFAQHVHTHQKANAKPTALTGEVLDLTCFMQHPADAVGVDHAKCAKTCINKGLPIGFLAEDGTVYLLIGNGHEPVAPMVSGVAGKKVTINGIIVTHHGTKAIELVSVAP